MPVDDPAGSSPLFHPWYWVAVFSTVPLLDSRAMFTVELSADADPVALGLGRAGFHLMKVPGVEILVELGAVVLVVNLVVFVFITHHALPHSFVRSTVSLLIRILYHAGSVPVQLLYHDFWWTRPPSASTWGRFLLLQTWVVRGYST